MGYRPLLALWLLAALAACDRTANLPAAESAAASEAPDGRPGGVSPPGGAVSFDRTLERDGVVLRVVTTGEGSVRELMITPVGTAPGAPPVTRETDGTVTNAELADLNADGEPELYVYTVSAGSGSYGNVIAYSISGEGLSGIQLPALAESPEAAAGYGGHDAFTVDGTTLVRRFPVYREGDPNVRPTGGTRELRYGLAAGGSGWVLQLDEVIEH